MPSVRKSAAECVQRFYRCELEGLLKLVTYVLPQQSERAEDPAVTWIDEGGEIPNEIVQSRPPTLMNYRHVGCYILNFRPKA